MSPFNIILPWAPLSFSRLSSILYTVTSFLTVCVFFYFSAIFYANYFQVLKHSLRHIFLNHSHSTSSIMKVGPSFPSAAFKTALYFCEQMFQRRLFLSAILRHESTWHDLTGDHHLSLVALSIQLLVSVCTATCVALSSTNHWRSRAALSTACYLIITQYG
jgi:hypothetical protein